MRRGIPIEKERSQRESLINRALKGNMTNVNINHQRNIGRERRKIPPKDMYSFSNVSIHQSFSIAISMYTQYIIMYIVAMC